MLPSTKNVGRTHIKEARLNDPGWDCCCVLTRIDAETSLVMDVHTFCRTRWEAAQNGTASRQQGCTTMPQCVPSGC